MSGSWLHRILVLLSACALAAIVYGVPPVGSLAAPEVEAATAWLAHMLFAGLALAAWRTSPAVSAKAVVADSGWPSLRSMAVAAPAVVVLQVALGAAYRHKVMGAIPHVVWAFVAAIVVMMVAVSVMTHAQALAGMKRTCVWLLRLIGIQVVLGVAALVARMMGAEAGLAIRAALMTHAGTGALVLALTVVLSAQILRHVEQAPETGSSRHELASPGHHS
jgi:heme A synthase